MTMLRELSEVDRRILPFSVPPARRTIRMLSESGPTGTVLLFTGVRYSRQADEAAETVRGDDVPAGRQTGN